VIIPTLLLLLAQGQPYQPHSRELPETAIEWVDHYGYCLEVNHGQVMDAFPDRGSSYAAARAAIRCWPVRSGAHSKIIVHLTKDGARADANERHEIADRTLNMAARDFALRVGASPADLRELCAPYTNGDCDASD
jgi:hypothetical protein